MSFLTKGLALFLFVIICITAASVAPPFYDAGYKAGFCAGVKPLLPRDDVAHGIHNGKMFSCATEK